MYLNAGLQPEKNMIEAVLIVLFVYIFVSSVFLSSLKKQTEATKTNDMTDTSATVCLLLATALKCD